MRTLLHAAYFLGVLVALPVLASDDVVLTTGDLHGWVPIAALLVTGGIAWGVERQARKELSVRHNEATRESRNRLGSLEARSAVQEKESQERTTHLDKEIVGLRGRVDATVEALARLDVKQERDREDIVRSLEKVTDSLQHMRDEFNRTFATLANTRVDHLPTQKSQRSFLDK